MPLRHQPHSLRKLALKSIADNFDRICYNVSDKEDMMKLDSEAYMDVQSPLYDMRKYDLTQCLHFISEHLTYINICFKMSVF